MGKSILESGEALARDLGLQRLYLFTLGKGPFYEKFGYEQVPYDAFPPSARKSFQYQMVAKRGKEWGVTAWAKDA